ncbi:conserved protein of unknown function [Enterobacter cancerogenus]|nr:conserved protein of unknown function [Enterobacter cancerogenus]
MFLTNFGRYLNKIRAEKILVFSSQIIELFLALFFMFKNAGAVFGDKRLSGETSSGLY